MKHSILLRVGPRTFRIGSDWHRPIVELKSLYASYLHMLSETDTIPDYTVRLEATRFWRRTVRPSVGIRGDHELADAVPTSLAHGLLAAEMAMNLQMALGERRYLLLHASSVEKDGRVLIMTGESGSGKSTLSALLGHDGWRFMGDEFALIDTMTGLAHPFPRPVSLKGDAIALMRAALPKAQFGPVQRDTPKGDVCHLVPPRAAIDAMDRPAKPALILFPRYSFAREMRSVGTSEAFVRLTQASTNYTALGEAGFLALTTLVTTVPSCAIDYPDTKTAVALVTSLWADLA